MNNVTSSKQISVLWAITLTVGAMVGSAIFSLSGVTIAFAGSYSILSWALAALINLAFAMVVAQLARRWPGEDGGIYVYPKRIIEKTFGAKKAAQKSAQKSASLVGYIGMVVYAAGCFAGVIFSCSYFAKYLFYILPVQGDTGILVAVASILVLLLCALLNISGLKTSVRINGVLVIFLALLMVFLAFYFVNSGAFSFGNISAKAGDSPFESISISLPVAILAYGAIVTPAFLSSSLKNPKKNVPVVMLVSMLVVAALYILQMVILNGVLPSSYGSDASELYTPYFSALGVVSSASGVQTISIFVTVGSLLALFTTALVLMRLLAVSLQRAATEGSLPKPVAKSWAPYQGVCVVGAVILLLGDQAINLVQLGAILNVIYFGVICVCALLFKELAPFWRVLALSVLVVLLLCSVGSVLDGGITQVIFSAVILAAALIFYFLHQRFASKRLIEGKGDDAQNISATNTSVNGGTTQELLNDINHVESD
ncbi:MAG: APC family permease [Candidatus Ancillula sp.]|jgi:amino acid transporter|nr:APC family permease [Candidatus Ancillula sp.]